jgi:hypothetical protein
MRWLVSSFHNSTRFEGLMELTESLCSLVVEHILVPDYTASHPSVTFAFLGKVCHRDVCGMYSFYLTGANSHTCYLLHKV